MIAIWVCAILLFVWLVCLSILEVLCERWAKNIAWIVVYRHHNPVIDKTIADLDRCLGKVIKGSGAMRSFSVKKGGD
jgi:hypothetical protein